MPALTVYLAGPEVFLPDPVAAGRAKKEACADFGFHGLYPLDNDLAARPGETATALSRRIYAANRELMGGADVGVFNLTPFRGPSADPGTVFELGYMLGLGKPVFAYTNVACDYRARVMGDDGLSVEDFGNADNLMIDSALDWGGFELVRVAAPPAELWRDLTGFRRCLEMASAFMRAPRPPAGSAAGPLPLPTGEGSEPSLLPPGEGGAHARKGAGG